MMPRPPGFGVCAGHRIDPHLESRSPGFFVSLCSLLTLLRSPSLGRHHPRPFKLHLRAERWFELRLYQPQDDAEEPFACIHCHPPSITVRSLLHEPGDYHHFDQHEQSMFEGSFGGDVHEQKRPVGCRKTHLAAAGPAVMLNLG